MSANFFAVQACRKNRNHNAGSIVAAGLRDGAGSPTTEPEEAPDLDHPQRDRGDRRHRHHGAEQDAPALLDGGRELHEGREDGD